MSSARALRRSAAYLGTTIPKGILAAAAFISGGVGCTAGRPPEAPRVALAPSSGRGSSGAPGPALTNEGKAPPAGWQSLGRCSTLQQSTPKGNVLVVASETDRYALALPPHPLVRVDCSETTLAKRPGLVVEVTYPSIDAHVDLFMEPHSELVEESVTLENLSKRDSAALGSRAGASVTSSKVLGKLGAMMAIVKGTLRAPSGASVPFTQWTTIRQRASDKRLYTMTIAASDTTPENAEMWRSLAAVHDNPLIQDEDDTAPFDPKSPQSLTHLPATAPAPIEPAPAMPR